MLYAAMALLGLGLSMDTLAVAVATGICKTDVNRRDALRLASTFSFFQMLMPFLGWLAGSQILTLIEPFDHWIAFALLVFIGFKLIHETWQEQKRDPTGEKIECPRDPTAWKRLILLAIATSIDALAAGISLAVEQTPILPALLIIGLITFLVAFAGTLLGRRLGVFFQRRACYLGGLVLALLGTKILFEHLGLLS